VEEDTTLRTEAAHHFSDSKTARGPTAKWNPLFRQDGFSISTLAPTGGMATTKKTERNTLSQNSEAIL